MIQKKEILPQHIYFDDAPKEVLKELDDFIPKATFEFDVNNWQTEKFRLLDKRELQKTHSFISKSVHDVARAEFGDQHDWVITHSWLNKNLNGNWHSRHIHPNSKIVGFLYLTDSPAKTWFSVDSIWPKDVEFIFSPNDREPNEIIHKEDSSRGKLFVFPATLVHSVSEHWGEYPRYSLGFNAIPTGQFGFKNGRTDVTIQVS